MRIGVILNYDNLAEIAKNLITENGARAVLRTPQGNPVYNPATNEYESPEISCNGIALITSYEDRLIDGTVIRIGDRLVKAIFDGEPKTGTSKLDIYNSAGIKTETYNIIKSETVNPNGDKIIMYNLQCRK
jgi:hypothetical protein